MENWKHIPESPNYLISDNGNLKNIKSGRLIKAQLRKPNKKDKNPGLIYAIHDKDTIHNKKHIIRRAVSTLVFRAFKPEEYIEGKPLYRLDGDIHNNNISNFAYIDQNRITAYDKRKQLIDSMTNEWIIGGDISDSRNIMSVTHKKCGKPFKEILSSIISNGKPFCRYCYTLSKNRSRLPELNKRLAYKSVGRYQVVSPLNRMDDPVEVLDDKYGKTFLVDKARKILGNNISLASPFDYSCQSSGESMIEYMLIKHNVSYIWQFYFNDCRNILPLPFDFAIMNGNVPVAMIEYQGEQHYKNVKVFGNSLEEQKKADTIKAEYCKHKGLPLFTVRGDDYNEVMSELSSIWD